MFGFCTGAFERMPPTTDLPPPHACGTLKCEVDPFSEQGELLVVQAWVAALGITLIGVHDSIFASQLRQQLRDALVIGFGQKRAVLKSLPVALCQVWKFLFQKGQEHSRGAGFEE